MNLFYNPSVNELQKLITKNLKSASEHNIVIDYDGEVLIDPDLVQPDLDLNKFKFRIKLNAIRKHYIKRGSSWLSILLNNLVKGWKEGLNSYSSHSLN
jgi:hypothetical protein